MDVEAWMCSSLYRQRFDCPHTLHYLPLDPLDSSCWFLRHQTLECKLTTPSQKLIRFVMSGPRNFLFPRKKKNLQFMKKQNMETDGMGRQRWKFQGRSSSTVCCSRIPGRKAAKYNSSYLDSFALKWGFDSAYIGS